MLEALAVAATAYFGTTEFGGAYGAGMAFVHEHGKPLQTIYDFCATPECVDGAHPVGSLIHLADGSLVGETRDGGVFNQLWPAAGVVFRLFPTTSGLWSEEIVMPLCLYWQDCAHYGRPNGALTLISAHKVEGTVSDENGRGAVWTVDFLPHDVGVLTPVKLWGKNGPR